MDKLWKYIIAAFGIITGLFFYEREKKLDAEAKLDNADVKKDDAVLEQHTTDLQKQAQEDKVQAETLKNETTTPKQLLDFLNKKS